MKIYLTWVGLTEGMTTTTGTTVTATVPEEVSPTGFGTTTPEGLHISSCFGPVQPQFEL